MHVFVCIQTSKWRVNDEDPRGPRPEFAQRGCAGNQHFLLPVTRGSATVAVPLSLDTQAAQSGERKAEEEEKETGVDSRLDKGRGCVHQLFCLVFCFVLVLAENAKKAVNDDRRKTAMRKRTCVKCLPQAFNAFATLWKIQLMTFVMWAELFGCRHLSSGRIQ